MYQTNSIQGAEDFAGIESSKRQRRTPVLERGSDMGNAAGSQPTAGLLSGSLVVRAAETEEISTQTDNLDDEQVSQVSLLLSKVYSPTAIIQGLS